MRALPLLRSMADFDKLDARMQAKISVRSSGNSQRAIMANMSGTVFAIFFQDGAIRGLNVVQMIRSADLEPALGMAGGRGTLHRSHAAFRPFKIDKGRRRPPIFNLVGPLVRMTGAGTIDLGTRQIGFRVEPNLVMTTEGQGRAGDFVGFGIPVMIEGPWTEPRIYPDMQGILDNPDAAYARSELGKGLFGLMAPRSAASSGCSAALEWHRCSRRQYGRRAMPTASVRSPGGQPWRDDRQPPQQGLNGGFGQSGASRPSQPGSQGRSLAPPETATQPPPPPPAPSDCGRAAGQSANERGAAAAVQPLTGRNGTIRVRDHSQPLHFYKQALSAPASK